MASFSRLCRKCTSGQIHVISNDNKMVMMPCAYCNGTSRVDANISIDVNIRPQYGIPKSFTMIVTPDGRVGFRGKGKRTIVWTSTQSCFNRAQAETAAALLKDKPIKRRRFVKRGLLGGAR